MAIDDPNCLRIGDGNFGGAYAKEGRVILAVEKIVLVWSA